MPLNWKTHFLFFFFWEALQCAMHHVHSTPVHAFLGFDWPRQTPGYTSAALLIPYMKIQNSKLQPHKTICCDALLVYCLHFWESHSQFMHLPVQGKSHSLWQPRKSCFQQIRDLSNIQELSYLYILPILCLTLRRLRHHPLSAATDVLWECFCSTSEAGPAETGVQNHWIPFLIFGWGSNPSRKHWISTATKAGRALHLSACCEGHAQNSP